MTQTYSFDGEQKGGDNANANGIGQAEVAEANL